MMRAFAFNLHRFRADMIKQNKPKRKRWLTKHCRKDLQTLTDFLPRVNCTVPLPVQPLKGRTRAEPCCTDASGGKTAGGAWVTPSDYDAWQYKGKQKKLDIALLEGDAVFRYLKAKAHTLNGMLVPMYIDNQAFLYSLLKGYSASRKICSLVQQILMLCYDHDIYLDLFYITSANNIVADAASRQYWDIFHAHYNYFWLFADTRAKQLKAKTEPTDNSQCDIQQLPARVRFAVRKFESEAYEESTRDNAKTSWTYWEQYHNGMPHLWVWCPKAPDI
jgi:hypothetical protein